VGLLAGCTYCAQTTADLFGKEGLHEGMDYVYDSVMYGRAGKKSAERNRDVKKHMTSDHLQMASYGQITIGSEKNEEEENPSSTVA
jgi:hypothetical protein